MPAEEEVESNTKFIARRDCALAIVVLSVDQMLLTHLETPVTPSSFEEIGRTSWS